MRKMAIAIQNGIKYIDLEIPKRSLNTPMAEFAIIFTIDAPAIITLETLVESLKYMLKQRTRTG